MDRLTARADGANLLANPAERVETVEAESDRSKRVPGKYNPKLNGKQRPSGIPAIPGTDGRVIESEEGIPQGSIVSPIPANVYLHRVLNRWFSDSHSAHTHRA